jgi:Flp pilus assembly protein TadD
MNVADAAIAGGDPQMALKVSQSVLANDPNNLDALYHEGQAYYAINRCEDAVAVYKVALKVDPKSSDAELGIGRCLLKRNAAEAEIAFQAAAADNPSNAAALNDLGIARDLQGNHAGAVQPYQQALLLNPGNLATEVNLGMSLALSGNGGEALQYLGPLATSPDATPKIREDYAAALVAAGRVDEARRVLAVDMPPDQITQLINDFSAVMTSSQPPIGEAAAGQAAASQASADTATSYAAAPSAGVKSTPVAQTALAAPASVAPATVASAFTASAAVVPAPGTARAVAAPASAATPATPNEAIAAPPPVVAAVDPAPASTKPPVLERSGPSDDASSSTGPASIQPVQPMANDLRAAPPPAASEAASFPEVTPSVDAPPSDNTPTDPTPPPAAQPASTQPPVQATSSNWWNGIRAPTGH